MNKKHAGRKPKPTNLHVLHGSYNPTRHGRDREGEIEPTPFDFHREPPKELSPQAREHWNTVLASLEEANILATMDTDGLVLYCETWVRWAEANANIEKFGMVIRSPKDNKTPVQSPYFSISLKTGEQLRRLLTEFGMTPVSRVGLKSGKKTPAPEEGSLAAWIQEKPGVSG